MMYMQMPRKDRSAYTLDLLTLTRDTRAGDRAKRLRPAMAARHEVETRGAVAFDLERRERAPFGSLLFAAAHESPVLFPNSQGETYVELG